MTFWNLSKLVNRISKKLAKISCKVIVLDSNIIIELLIKGSNQKEKEKILKFLKKKECEYFIAHKEDLLNGILSFLEKSKKTNEYLIINKEIGKILKNYYKYPYLSQDYKIKTKYLNEEDLLKLSSNLIEIVIKHLPKNGKLGLNIKLLEEEDFKMFLGSLSTRKEKYELIKRELEREIIECRKELNKKRIIPKKEEFEIDYDVELISQIHIYFFEYIDNQNFKEICFLTGDSDFSCKRVREIVKKLTKIKVIYINLK